MNVIDNDGKAVSVLDRFFASPPDGVKYLCEVPAALGAVTKLRIINGRVIAETASGHTMIVPHQPARGC